ncbi:SH3 domain-containing protein [Entamoeba marina]
MSLKRGLFNLKSSVGISKTTADPDLKVLESNLLSTEKKLKQLVARLPKIPKSAQNLIIYQKESFRLMSDCSTDNSASKNVCESVINVFDKVEESGSNLKDVVQIQIIEPVKDYMNQWSVLHKRFLLLKTRKTDMDRYKEKYESIKKKPSKKQKGLSIAESKFNLCTESYTLLRDEIANDVTKLCLSVDDVCMRITNFLLTSFTDYINALSIAWTPIPDVLKQLPTGDIPTTPVYTPKDESMLNECLTRDKKIENAMGEPKIKAKSTRQTPIGKYGTCEFEYIATDETELTIREGDVIKILSVEDGWGEGELNGEKGLFPINYIKY